MTDKAKAEQMAVEVAYSTVDHSDIRGSASRWGPPSWWSLLHPNPMISWGEGAPSHFNAQRDNLIGETMGNMVLGVHSNIAGDDQEYTGGHAWLTITHDGKTTCYGLWPDAHPDVLDNGDKSDIRIGMEASQKAVASRYYRLSDAQAKHFNSLMNANVAWRYTNTCASWASEIVEEVLGEDVDADDYGGFETPRELGRNILLLEKKQPTTLPSPRPLNQNPASSFMKKRG